MELARPLGLSVSAAKSRVQRARAMVRDERERCCRWEADWYGTVVDVRVAVKQTSRAFINGWMPGAQSGNCVTLADITARKPQAACYRESRCGEGHPVRGAEADVVGMGNAVVRLRSDW